MAENGRIGVGLIGCGAFGLFCLEAFSRMPEVRVAAVADVVKAAADKAAKTFAVPGHHDPAELLARSDVDLVHVATPPATHYDLVMSALAAGKHCLCEKPLAVNTDHALEMLATAREKGLIVPVNFVLRHNKVTEAVKAVIDSGVLGEVLAGTLTNCAGDTPLGPDHWFWDREVSGGIFVEHGVHFFDLYRYWLGPGEVISAHAEMRQGTDQEDRVLCCVRHAGGAVVSHYHGFDQITAMDRTDHRLICEMGDIKVSGWIPLSMEIDAAVDEQGAAVLARCAPGCEVEPVARYEGLSRRTTGRGKQRAVTERIKLSFTPEADKQAVYANSVRGLLADQIEFLRNKAHARRITEANGRDSLAMAQAAARLAKRDG